MTMNTTLVINAKGGVGKSTITTNLASYFAARDVTTTIADFDPQGSSLTQPQRFGIVSIVTSETGWFGPLRSELVRFLLFSASG